MENNSRCDFYNIDVHRALYAKHLRSRKRLEKEKQIDMIKPDWLLKEEKTPIRKKIKKFVTPKH